MNIYWGDIHNHCNITYGFGSLENAMRIAKSHLDFVAIVGHAMWPDIYEKNPDTEFLVNFHEEGFAKLRAHWPEIRQFVKENNKDGEFVTFQGYEMHSSKYGDHHFITPDDNMPLIEAEGPAKWIKASGLEKVVAVPHHISYTPGYRGISWDDFSEQNSPIVEVMSKHGCSMSDSAPYNYYHNMGPRDGRNTVFSGLKAGHRFGFVASTDHHAGFPGSYGDGRMAVLAKEKTRESIWEAIMNRRTYAVTGDKIKVDFSLNDSPMGSEINTSDKRNINLKVEACDFIDKIVVYKNLEPFYVLNGESIKRKPSDKYKVRIEMGWGNKKEGVKWQGNAKINGGKLLDVEKCFRGRSVLSPSEDESYSNQVNDIHNEVINQNETGCEWVCESFKNISQLHPMTAALVLEIEGNMDTVIDLSLNGATKSVSLGELSEYGVTSHIKPYHSPAFAVRKAVWESEYNIELNLEDKPSGESDFYFVEIRQTNGQCAWVSPIFVN